MKKNVINARELVADIKSGKDDMALQQKYGVQPENLARLKNELLARRLLTIDELRSQQGPLKTRIRINPDRFLYDFRQTQDDNFLMRKYSLKPEQLKRVYDDLMESYLLTSAEYECRTGKNQAVDASLEASEAVTQEFEPSPPVDTVVTPPLTSHVEGMRDSQLPKEFFLDYSGIRIGSGSRSGLSAADDNLPGHRDAVAMRGRDYELFRHLQEEDCCPKCQSPKHPDSLDSCVKCGVVFAKVEKKGKIVTGSVWDDSESER